MSEFQQDFLGVDIEAKGDKWESLQARCSPEEKRDVYLYCKTIAKMPYSVLTRLIWRRIIHNYRTMPQARLNETDEIFKATDEVLDYIPVVRKQRRHAVREF